MKDELIRFAPLFTGLTDQQRDMLSAAFVAGESPADTVLLRAGERSEAIYLIEQGFVSLTTPSGANLATLGPGSLIGEASLFRNVPQDVNAVSLSELKYWQLTDRALRELIIQQPAIGLKLGENFGGLLAQMEDYLARRLSQAAELAGLPQNTLREVAGRLQPRRVKAQDTIYRPGEPPVGLFLIEQGGVELRSDVETSGDGPEKLRPGMLFGVLPLLTSKPYSQSAIATEPTLLWTLSLDSFNAIGSKIPGLRRSLARTTRMRLNKTDQSQAILRLSQMTMWGEEPSPQTMRAVAQRMMLQHVPAGERVYMMGEAGDALYLVESGEIGLTAENSAGAVEERAWIGSDGYFGDLSLLTGQVRTEDATAIRNSNLWVLNKSDLDVLAAQHPEIGKALSQGLAARLADQPQEQGIERFRQFALLAELGEQELAQVVDHLHPMRYRSGEQIYRAATPAEMLYLLERGQVRLQSMGGNRLLGEGEAFGERALLANQPHNAGAIAETDVDVWTLSKQDFDVLMNRFPMLAISMSRMLSQRMDNFNGEPQAVPSAMVGGASDPYFENQYNDQQGEPLGFEPDNSMPANNTPSRRRRNQAAQQSYSDAPPRKRRSIGEWFSDLSTIGKVQLAVLLLLLIWLIGIAAPAAMLSLLQGTSVARGAEVATRSNLLNALNSVYAVGSYEVAEKDKALAEALAMADQAVPPTPTYTPVATQTPIPTATPLPTNTPTPVPSATFTPTPRPFVQQFVPPTAEPEPVAEVAAAAPPRAWDPRLDQLGVYVDEAQVEPGQPYWRLIEARWANEKESGGKHHIYVDVLDENGNRIVNHPVTVFWGEGSHTAGVEDKAPPDYGYNYQMYAAGNAYNVQVEGLPSDILRGAGMGDIDRPDWGIHTSFYITYKRAIR